MNFVEDLLLRLVKDVFGRYEFEYEGQQIEFKKPFKRVEFNSLVNEYLGLDCEESSLKDFQKKADELKLKIEKNISKGSLIDELFKKAIRPKIIEPTFVINHPWEISPLAKRIPDKPKFVQRFHLIIEGTELVNAFSELNDPVDQLERFKEQEKAHDQGEKEAHRLDKEFIEALEYGMPPAAGMGLGIDRLAALLTNSHSLRDIILFPTMKPRE
jgi:lysyl-tRNA synthetase class 2